jgi:predicted nucleic acid-binding Zn ribbon protein
MYADTAIFETSVSFEPIKKTLRKVARHRPLGRALAISALLARCGAALQELMGEEIARHYVPISFKEGVLKVYCPSPAHRAELASIRMALLRTLNKGASPSLRVRRLIFSGAKPPLAPEAQH